MIKSSKQLTKKFYCLNQYIRAPKVRVIDEKGKQVGVFSISVALQKARELNLDLVEVAPDAQPPVCKLIDFRKFKYLEEKKRQESKRKSKKVEIKDVRVSPFIAENDLRFRLKRAQDFLKEGNKVKIAVRFRGRQITKKEFGYELIKKVKDCLGAYSEVEIEPRFVGQNLEMQLSPIKQGKNDKQKAKN